MRKFKALLGLAVSALVSPAMAQYASPAPEPQVESGYDRLEQILWEGAARSNTPDGYQTYLRRYPQGPHSDQARSQLDRFYGRAPAQPYPQQAVPAYPPPPSQTYSQPEPQQPAGYAPQIEGVATPAGQPALPPVPEPAAPPAAAMGEAAAVTAPAITPPMPASSAPAPAVAAAEPKAVRQGSPLFLCRPVFAGGTPPFEQAGEAEISAYLQALKINSVPAYQAYIKAYPQGIFAPAVNELIATREGRAKALAATTVPGPSQAHARAPVTIAAADYPPGATAAGSATAIWEVADDGCVQYCRIEKSSGSPALDAATCRILSARGGYEPARDAAGKPIRAIETGTFNWAPPAK